MIELTTGIVFLASSMYGAGSATAHAVNIQSLTSNSTSTTPAMVVTTDRKVVEQYLKKNFADTPILVEIARCESEFRQFDKNGQVVRGRVDRADVGVMQINERYHLDTAKGLGLDIYTIEGNTAYAKYLYTKSGLDSWNASKPCWGNTTVAMNTK